LERPSHLHRIETAGAQLLVTEPRVRALTKLVEERRQPVRIAGRGAERVAQPAGTIAASQRLAGVRRELDVLGLRLPRVARRAAEDSRRPDTGHKQPVVARIAPAERAVHLVEGRKGSHGRSLRVFRIPRYREMDG